MAGRPCKHDALATALISAVSVAAVTTTVAPGSPLTGPFDVSQPHAGPNGPRQGGLLSAGGGRLYLAYSCFPDVFLAQSHDGGFSWLRPDLPITEPGERGSVFDTIQQDDEIGIVWREFTDLDTDDLVYTRVDESGAGRVTAQMLSTPPGWSGFLDAAVRVATEDRLVALACIEDRDLTFPVVSLDSHDGGATWSAPAPVDTVRDYNGLTRIAVDDAPDGTLYAVLADQTHGEESLRFFTLDPGADRWTRTRVEPLPDGWTVFGLPSLSVAGDGRIGLVAYYLRYVPGNYLHAVFFSASHDGGQSWAPPVQLSPSGSDDVHWEPHIAADGRGRWHVTWLSHPPQYTRSLDSAGAAWMDPVAVTPDSLFAITIIPRTLSIAADEAGDAYITVHVGPHGRERLILMTTRARPYDGLDGLPFYTAIAAPNPFRQATTITLFVPEPARGGVRIFDPHGRRVRSWPFLPLVRGANLVHWDGRREDGTAVASGVYFWEARFGDGTDAHPEAQGRIVRIR
jgi:hypothetical protein